MTYHWVQHITKSNSNSNISHRTCLLNGQILPKHLSQSLQLSMDLLLEEAVNLVRV